MKLKFLIHRIRTPMYLWKHPRNLLICLVFKRKNNPHITHELLIESEYDYRQSAITQEIYEKYTYKQL